MELTPAESTSASDLDSEVEIYPLCSDDDNDSSEDSISRAWGSNRETFYIGKQDGSDCETLEEEATLFTQNKSFSAMCRDDFLSPWLKAIKYEQVGGVAVSALHMNKDPILENITRSLEKVTTWLLKYGVQQCCVKSPASQRGSVCVQSKIHLSFCYGLNVLYYLLLKRNQQNCSEHPVVGQMTLLHELLCTEEITCGPTIQASLQTGDCTVQSQPTGGFKVEEKRNITYEIASNKGILPKRKREQRNPRVKHRNKYKRAMIKRKSQVLPVVQELYKYGGEASGIRSKLARSTRIN